MACFKGIATVQLVFTSVGKCLFDYEFLLCCFIRMWSSHKGLCIMNAKLQTCKCQRFEYTKLHSSLVWSINASEDFEKGH